jgi:hypothetical protein
VKSVALTKKQIEKLKQIIDKHMDIIMSLTTGGGKKPSPAVLKKLGLPAEFTDLITDAYKYGKLGVLKGKPIDKMSADEIEKLLKTTSITAAQKSAVELSQINAQQHINSLNAKVTSSVLSLAIKEQLNMYTTVEQVVPEAIKNSTERYKVIQQLREMSGDWERDWHRVAHTEMWDAKVHGEAQAIFNGESPLSNKKGETKVFKRPGPNACSMCKKLYLEPDGVTPRIFTLSELQANGTNYGKKQRDWVATLGTLHPNCLCPLSVMPDGYHFNSIGQLEPD